MKNKVYFVSQDNVISELDLSTSNVVYSETLGFDNPIDFVNVRKLARTSDVYCKIIESDGEYKLISSTSIDKLNGEE